MRKLIPILFFLAACNSQQSKRTSSSISDSSSVTTTANPLPAGPSDICWQGFLDDKVPVLIHYQEKDSVVAGEIIYLNTKARTPIPLYGTVGEDGYRLLEFEKDGNITGIITGKPNGMSFEGSWYAPKSRKTMRMELANKDTFIAATLLEAESASVYGDYHYEYSADGYNGDLTIKKADLENVAFSIFSVTDGPAFNMADMRGGEDGDKPNIAPMSNNTIIYSVPEEEACAFRIRFFKGFAVLNYLPAQECEGQFGHNATVEGVFLKIN